MIVGRVVGTVIATQKDDKLQGFKLLVVDQCKLDGTSVGKHYVAVDTVGAGMDEVVIMVSGSSARMTSKTSDCPVDAAIVCIVDSIEAHGKVVFRKFGEPDK